MRRHTRIRKQAWAAIALAAVAALAAAPVFAAYMYPAAPDFAYEGDAIPAGAPQVPGWGTVNTTGNLVGPASDGDIMGVATTNQGFAAYYASSTDFDSQDDTWTIDFRVRRDMTVIGGFPKMQGTTSAPWMNLSIGGAGNHSGTMNLSLGNDGDVAGNGDSNLLRTRLLTGGQDLRTALTLPGLDIDEFTYYRVVGAGGDGTVKVYSPFLGPEPIFTGELLGGLSAGSVGFGMQGATWAPGVFGIDVDFIRAYHGAFDENIYIPEPTTALLLVLGGLALVRRHRPFRRRGG